MPRFSSGVPITLGFINLHSNIQEIKPYPDYTWHSANGLNCDKMTSVFRVAIDECQRMWVLDNGIVNRVRVCPPQLLLFNLTNDKLMHRYKFPRNQYIETSAFITPVRSFLLPNLIFNFPDVISIFLPRLLILMYRTDVKIPKYMWLM